MTPAFVRRRLGAKFLVALLLVAVLISVIGFATYVEIQGTIQEEATDELEMTGQLRAQSVSQWVAGTRAQTALVADPQLAPNETALNASLSAAKAGGGSAIIDIHYVDTDRNTVLASTNDDYERRGLDDDESDRSSSDEVGSNWIDPLARLGEDSDAVTFSRRSYTVGGDRAIALVSRVTENSAVVVVSRFVPTFDDSDIRTTLVTAEGNRVATTDAAREFERTDAFTAAVEAGTSRTIEAGGEVRTYVPVEGTDWIAVSTAPKDDLYSVSATVGRNVLLLAVTALASLAAVGFILGRNTVVPLVALKEHVRAIESGSLDADLETAREDEIGQLFGAFDNMRDALEVQFREARQARHEAESSRREMERQNRRLDQFASTLSHDLRNPLAVARGHVELLRTKLDDSQGELLEHVEKIDGAHGRIDSIIDDVLTLTRKGESVEETERFELEDAAREGWGNVDSRDATLRVEDSIAIEGDRSRLLRALENLFRNSIDHVGPEVTVTVGLTEDGFYVEDDGPGIPDEEMDAIFEYGHTNSEDGTGIGLSIVKTIAEAHGWSVWVDGTSGRGARFVFSDVFATEERLFEESAFTWEHARADDD
ncbi:sensor histidine kinase [Halapricum desulfuricans]|uniref:sensor histidine kinase n=1 Tax=Halapricum desulfuricans TaxID=2841257 RepID=UPI001E57FCD8|nr:ATP-binding protein [Halapricum desulfuricans]